MRNFLSLLLAASLTCATAARAEDDCEVPMALWQPREAVRAMAEKEGWKVRRIKIDDGCYELVGFDKTGRRIEVKINPATLKVIQIEHERDDD